MMIGLLAPFIVIIIIIIIIVIMMMIDNIIIIMDQIIEYIHLFCSFSQIKWFFFWLKNSNKSLPIGIVFIDKKNFFFRFSIDFPLKLPNFISFRFSFFVVHQKMTCFLRLLLKNRNRKT